MFSAEASTASGNRLKASVVWAAGVGVAALLIGPAQPTSTAPWSVYVVAMTLAAATAGYWPRISSVACCALLAVAVIPMDFYSLADYAVLIPIGVLVKRRLLAAAGTVTAAALALHTAHEFLVKNRLDRQLLLDLAINGLLFTVVWVILWRIGTLTARTTRLERERELVARQQRLLIARELHDTVVHTLTTAVMRAELAALSEPADARNQELVGVADEIRRATADLRSMLVALREPGLPQDAVLAGPDLDLAEVLEQRCAMLGAAGFTVRSTVQGEIASLPASANSALSKVLAEASANASKYAPPGSEITVMVDVTEDEARLLMSNAIHHRPAQAGHGGLGLVGARERVTVLGGELETTRTAATWTIHAWVPVNRT